MTLKIETLEVTPFQQNCRVLYEEGALKASAVIIDPGGDVDLIVKFLEDKKIENFEVWLTHSHLDHCGGVAGLERELKRKYPFILKGSKIGKEMRRSVEMIKEMYGLSESDLENCPEPDEYLKEGDILEVKNLEGSFKFEVMETPGHSPDHLCFYCKELDLLIAGDTLFFGSVGRTDLPGGSQTQLMDSIKSKIFSLPDSTKVLPGHGPDTSIGYEKRTNPYIVKG